MQQENTPGTSPGLRSAMNYAPENIRLVQSLQALRDSALDLAIKYRWDPAVGRAHAEYLNELNTILRGLE